MEESEIKPQKTISKIVRIISSFWPILWTIFPDLLDAYWYVFLIFICYAIFSIISNLCGDNKNWRKISVCCFVINIIAILLPIVVVATLIFLLS